MSELLLTKIPGSVVAYQNQILTSNMYKVTLEIIPQRIMS